jgi:hypothetical protein
MTIIKQEAMERPPETKAEGQIHESVREAARSPQAESEGVADSMGALLKRVAGSSVREVDRVIAELQTMRDFLEDEAARIQREIVEYAHLSQAAMQATNVIAKNITRFVSDVDAKNQCDKSRATLLGPGIKERCRVTTGLRLEGGAVALVPQGGETPAHGRFQSTEVNPRIGVV